MYIIILGAPGAGKGTQAACIARELSLTHVASGDLFRQAVERGDKLGSSVKDYMNKGMLVPDEITIQMILERMSAADCRDGVILDGFPRNLRQAEALDKAFERKNSVIDWAIYIEVPDEELVRRLSGRWICRSCQTPYHSLSSPPKEQGKCELCGGTLYQRPDDSAETVKKRLKVYFTETMPVIEYYRQQGKLLEVDGKGGVDVVTDRILNALRKREFIAQ